LFIYLFINYYTIFKTPPLLQTEPLGNPAADNGIDFIDKFSIKVVSALSDVILLPIICELAKVEVLLF
jgi:hypothetical protein